MTNNREVNVQEMVIIRLEAAPGLSGAVVDITRDEAESLFDKLAETLGRDQ